MARTRKSLTERERCCTSLAALLALNRRSDAYKLLKKSSPSVQTVFLQEMFIHLSLVLGFPAMLDGLEYLRKIRQNGKAPSKRKRRSSSEGRRILRRIYGRQTDRLLKNIRQVHPDVRSMILKDVYGGIFARRGLTLRERELINVAVLAIQGLDRQLYSHLRGSVRVGLRVSAIEEALRLIQRQSRRSTRTARALLRVVVSQRKKL